ncbi:MULTISPECIES: hypothetical protein [Chryseobacterium]|uniref:Uncharacterized protein n=1 Tax=Chryseobacterium taihuense TaxID=1141221 RepID=A0A4U8WAQ3_9FLAO|nr:MULTISPECIES: hypothetical protein [Chryseobacterium]QQV03294.1 hypothetical protein I6I61_02735 [Chryseobacterium sp. FDAARGOS 1104]VFB03397.1 Uncharacterised protein [Chryseobacterium taihuense]
MMKKHLFLRFCLMFLVGVSVFSCRTEEFHNEEEAHGNTGLRLTSKRISISQAKHRTQLLPDLEKAETAIEKKALKVQGKSVNIGNGITIDTDEVIYIENGPDYHTYTFSVIRDNASANAPVENILMTPNTDGSYRVFHIVLNLTEADKVKIANREYVDYKNKQQVTELAGINLSSLTQKQICVPHYFSYPVSCKEGLHEPGQPCAYAGTSGAAYWGSIVLYDCFGEEPETIMPTPMPIDGGGGGGGTSPEEGEGQNPPYECTSAATDPTQVGLVSPTGCFIGMPSEPNIRPTQTPCGRALADINDPVFKQQFNNLNTDANYNNIHEKGIFERSAPIGSGLPSAFIPISNQSCTSHLDLPANKDGITGFFHIHNNNTCSNNPAFPSKVNIKAPSPADLRTFFHVIMKQANIYKGSYSKGYFVTMTDWGSYMFKYNGTNWPSNVTGADFARWSDWYSKEYQKLQDEQLMDSDNVKRVFAQFLKEVVQVDGLDVFEITENTASRLDYDPVTKKAVSTPCPKK